MVEIKNKEDIKAVRELLNKRNSVKKFNAKKFCGAIKFEEDAMLIQKRLRDEWN